MSSTRAVLFDLDNTLVMEDEATFSAVRSTCEFAATRVGVDPEALVAAVPLAAEKLWTASPVVGYAETMGIWWGEGLWGEFRGDAPELRELSVFVPGFRESVWRAALEAVDVADEPLARELVETYRAVRRARQMVDADAEPVLARLGSGHQLALVTNGAPDVQREKLAGTTLARHFAAIVISCEVGVAKPDPRIFQIALERIGADANEAVMVGDSLRRDVAGAHAARMRAVWIDRGLWPTETGPAPDVRIEALSDLPAALAAMGPVAASPRDARELRRG